MKTTLFSAMLGLLVMSMLVASGCKKHKDKDDDNPAVPTTVKDIDGNVYSVVKVGEQYWMGENLHTTRFRNGTEILTTNPPDKNLFYHPDAINQWPQNYDESLAKTLGRVYTGRAVADFRGLCPDGWKVPSEDDFNVLIQYLKDNQPQNYSSYPEMVLSPDPGHWQFPANMIGTPKNITGLSLIGGGIRLNYINDTTSTWAYYQRDLWLSTSTTYDGGNTLKYCSYLIGKGWFNNGIGANGKAAAGHVRCLKE